MSHQNKTECRLCRSQDLACVIHFPDTPVGDSYTPAPAPDLHRYPLHLNRCRTCGNLQLGEVVHPDVLYAKFTYRTAVSIELAAHFRDYCTHVSRRVGLQREDLVLDIGSNDGTLLRHFKDAGQRVLGVDPARQIATEASAAGIETLAAFFDPTLARSILQDRGQPRLILSNNTFANIDDLRTFFEGVKLLMGPETVFVFETGYAIDLAEKMIVDNIYHEHLTYFLVRPLATFFETLGLVLFDVESIPTKGGSIRGYVARPGAHGAHPRVADAARIEEARGMYDAATFLRLDERFARNRENLHRHLDRLAASGPIAGYGASVGVTTLLYGLGLGERLGVLADDNPRKHGLFSPGTCLKVIPGEALSAADFPNTLILPWRYADAICRNRASYLAAGGRFHVALPEVRAL